MTPKLHLYQAAYSSLPINVTISTDSLNFYPSAGDYLITLSANSYWNIVSNQKWLSVDKRSGDGSNVTIQVSATENTTDYIRRAKLLITVGDSIFSIPVTQSTATAATLAVSSATVKAKGTPDIVNIDVLSNVNWTVSKSDSWISIDKTSGWNNGTIPVLVTENPWGTSRTATVTLHSNLITKTVSIVQAKNPYFRLDKSILYLSGEDGSFENISVTSNTDWTAVSDSAWLTASPSTGNGNNTIVIAANENNTDSTRWANITCKADTIESTVLVYQLGKNPYAKAAEDTIEVSGLKTDSTVIHVNSNMLWDARSMASWIILHKTSGINSDSILFEFSQNPDNEKRYGEIYLLSSITHDIVDVIGVRQGTEKPIINLSNTVLNFTKDSLFDSISITANIPWTINNEVSWLSVSPESGQGDGVLFFTATYDSLAHDDVIFITAEGIEKQINVHMEVEAPFLTLSDSVLDFIKDRLSDSISLMANLPWTISNEAAWLEIYPTSGNGNSVITFIATYDDKIHNDLIKVTAKGIKKQIKVHIEGSNTAIIQPNIPVIQLYPNPSSGNFYLNVSNVQSSKLQVVIYDLTGAVVEKQLLNGSSTESILEIHTDLPQGKYLIELSGPDFKLTKQMIIIK